MPLGFPWFPDAQRPRHEAIGAWHLRCTGTFSREALLRDKGKPVARQGRKVTDERVTFIFLCERGEPPTGSGRFHDEGDYTSRTHTVWSGTHAVWYRHSDSSPSAFADDHSDQHKWHGGGSPGAR